MKHSQAFSLSSSSGRSFRNLLAEVDLLRIVASHKLEQSRKEAMGQFLTPLSVAELMAGMFQRFDMPEISLLDAGAGVGSLLAAFISSLIQQQKRPYTVRVVAYEVDPVLIGYLRQTLELYATQCQLIEISFEYEIREMDFIEDAVRILQPDFFMPLFSEPSGFIGTENPPQKSRLREFARKNGDQSNNLAFTHAILNPPYFKINTCSRTRKLLRSIGLETSNIYPGFMAAVAQLLNEGGELVAITPRSFCNGLYFRDFRRIFLEMMALSQIHLFESRQKAFRDDDVLQETVIIHAFKQKEKQPNVLISSSSGADDEFLMSNSLPYSDVVQPNDPEQFIRIVPDALSQQVVNQMANFTCSLKDLGLTVSTGRVVDFRAKKYLRLTTGSGTVPLIYPVNFTNGYVEHPKKTRKHQGLVRLEKTADLLIPNEHYVLTKRFSSKEEKKRVVAAIYDANRFDWEWVGFENHLNYFHENGRGLDIRLARGLAIYLNSSLVDSFFRLFNGHTQVNATDLRNLKYPSLEQLSSLGERIREQFPSQQEIDELVEEDLLNMTEQPGINPVAIKSRIDQALEILQQLDFPRAQLNERSALTLLALLDLKPDATWQTASSPMIGITPMMEFMAEYYGKTYKPNTRETVRRQTVHQFLDAALIVTNPDKPERPINSPKTVYRIEESALELLRTYGTPDWNKSIHTYLASGQTLKERYAQEREMSRIPVVIDGELKTLSAGGQNVLVEKIINEFAPRFTPSGKLLYVGDTDEKFAHFNEAALAEIGVIVNSHGKMPDVIIHFTKNDWLILIEAVTSHGPIDPKRKKELETLFKSSRVPLVMVTTFLSRNATIAYLAEIAWETDVWVAEAPTHLIHFNGQHLLQLYQPKSAE